MCFENNSINTLGTELICCSLDPITGFYRDGYCKTFKNDTGSHIVCAQVDKDFLQFSKQRGNDLITPLPEYNFKGLKEGDRWCLCADRWLEALQFNLAPKILLESTHKKILDKIDFNILKKYSLEYKNLN